jgi:hypothetical protein
MMPLSLLSLVSLVRTRRYGAANHDILLASKSGTSRLSSLRVEIHRYRSAFEQIPNRSRTLRLLLPCSLHSLHADVQVSLRLCGVRSEFE